MKIKSLEHFTQADFTRIVLMLYPLAEAVLYQGGQEFHPDYGWPDRQGDLLMDIGRRFVEFFEERPDD